MLKLLLSIFMLGGVAQAAHWPMETSAPAGFTVRGRPELVDGAEGKALLLHGSEVLEVKDSAAAGHEAAGFSLSVWVNPLASGQGQQMVAGKNRYSANEREWGVMLDADGRFRLYVWQGAWKTVGHPQPPTLGRWHHLGVVLRAEAAELWVNGALSGKVALQQPIPRTRAPLTLGGIVDGNSARQMLTGALDEARTFDRALPTSEMSALYRPVAATLPVPVPVKPVTLWSESVPLGKAAELPQAAGAEFHVIKKWDQPGDGYTFLHGVGLAWHKGKLYASIGHNKGAENTVTEEAQYRVSSDGGRTWSELRTIDAGEEPNLAISHGVFLSHAGKLWAFHGAYYNFMERIHTRAYSLNEATGEWVTHGVVVTNGFWALNEPQRLANGNWIIPGIAAGKYSNTNVFPAAVAISRGEDFTKWEFVGIPVDPAITRMWGESAVFQDGAKVFNLARYGGGAAALLAVSEDHGRTWSPSRISNLPMATSKPAAGVLSTGQRYLVCTTTADSGGRRFPLTIAVSKPGENVFSKVFVIRHALNPGQPGEAHPQAALSYPCATEHEGKLYVGFSNNGGRNGNLNSAELAVIPVASLKLP